MFAQERQAEIAELVSTSRRVSGADLSRRFDVTMETVRRDLAALEAAGRLRRVHGGAVSLDRPASVEAAIAGREAPKSPAKRRIAAVTLGHLPPALATPHLAPELQRLERLLDRLHRAGLEPR